MRYVIINADDFGLSPAVNRGIVQAHRSGGVTSTSLMVNMPGFEDALRLAASVPGLSVGLHFNLTYGRPVSTPEQVASLIGADGLFHRSQPIELWHPLHVERELSAQWRRMTDAGLRPTHLDSHHLLHQMHRMIYRVMVDKACREGVPLRRSQIDHGLPSRSDLLMTGGILLDTYGDDGAAARLHTYLRELAPGCTEIACHPGYVDAALCTVSDWTELRERELSVFADPELPAAMRQLGIHPISYRVWRMEQCHHVAAREQR